MEGAHTENTIRRNENSEQRKQDIMFIRNFLRQMDQTRVLRWRKDGQAHFTSPNEVSEMKESDAEHTGQMCALATFILYKAKNEGDNTCADSFDILKMNALIQLHDIEENIVGDSRDKDESYYVREKNAYEKIAMEINKMNFGNNFEILMQEYKERVTKEARFVKALDEIQAWFYLVYTKQFTESTRDFNNPNTIAGYVVAQEFPTLKRIADILLYVLTHPKMLSSKPIELENEISKTLVGLQYE